MSKLVDQALALIYELKTVKEDTALKEWVTTNFPEITIKELFNRVRDTFSEEEISAVLQPDTGKINYFTSQLQAASPIRFVFNDTYKIVVFTKRS
jgi:hypothetical protein